MQKRDVAIDIGMRLFALSTLSIFVYRVAGSLAETPSVVLATLLASEILIIGLVLCSKVTNTRSLSWASMASTAAATYYFLVIDLDGGEHLVPVWVSEAIMVTGMLWQITAKIYLGRNFGLLPARRGVVTTGPYSVVRHPIYLGYFVTHIGFLLNQFCLQNVLIVTLLYIFQVMRMINEEKALSESPEYEAYMLKVRRRFIPFIA